MSVIDVDANALHIEIDRTSTVDDTALTGLEDSVKFKTKTILITTFGSEVDSLPLKHIFP